MVMVRYLQRVHIIIVIIFRQKISLKGNDKKISAVPRSINLSGAEVSMALGQAGRRGTIRLVNIW